MKIIKRNGQEAIFDEVKITNAIIGANKEVVETERLSEEEIDNITNDIKYKCQKMKRALSVEEIQNLVEDELMKLNAFSVARKYITYRFQRALARQSNTTDDQILSLIECANEEVKQENSNKNPTVNSVQRDYMAGEVSKDLTRRILLPEDIVKAHDEGLIHFHDADYFSQHMHNCDLVNLEEDVYKRQFYGSADLFVVGPFGHTFDVSGVSIGSQTMSLITNLVLGLTTGVTVLLGQYLGSKSYRDLSKTIGGAIVLFLIIALGLTFVMLSFNTEITLLLNTPKEAIEATKS